MRNFFEVGHLLVKNYGLYCADFQKTAVERLQEEGFGFLKKFSFHINYIGIYKSENRDIPEISNYDLKSIIMNEKFLNSF